MKKLGKYRAFTASTLPALVCAVLGACQPDPEPPVTGENDAYMDESAVAGVERPAGSDLDGAQDARVQGAQLAAGSAKATLASRSDSDVGGTLELEEENGFLRIHGEIAGLTPGVHGLHVHEVGDCSAPDASSAGDHFAAQGAQHGAPSQPVAQHHAGDLGNIVADSGGVASIDVIDSTLSLSGSDAIVGRAIVVHAQADDLTSQPSGNSGDRVGCGVIELSTGLSSG